MERRRRHSPRARSFRARSVGRQHHPPPRAARHHHFGSTPRHCRIRSPTAPSHNSIPPSPPRTHPDCGRSAISMAAASLLRESAVQPHTPHHAPSAHPRLRHPPRHQCGSMPADIAGPPGLPSNQPSHGTPPTLPGRLRSDFSHSHRTASLLGIMGGHLSSPSTPIAVARRHAPAITSPPTSTATSVPGGHRRGTNLGASWVATARLACTHATGQSPTPQPFGGTTSQPRLATQGCHANLHDLPKRVANSSRPSQQSNARITNRPIRQSNLHHHPFRPGVHIPTRPVPHSSAPSFASPAPAVCASLPVPSLS